MMTAAPAQPGTMTQSSFFAHLMARLPNARRGIEQTAPLTERGAVGDGAALAAPHQMTPA
jgi:hypothetical protein